MHITLIPQRRATPLTVTRNGDILTLNGETFDFSPLPDGATLPREAPVLSSGSRACCTCR